MVTAHAISPVAHDPLEAVLAPFCDASAALLEERRLQRRIDSKYVVPGPAIVDLIRGLEDAYVALSVRTGRCATYRSLYFDTSELRCFHDHRRGRRLRHKIRIRHYPERELSFLEVKTKRNELVTDKHRLMLPYGTERLGERELAFVRGHAGAFADQLGPTVRIDYRRITMLSLHDSERVTIDIGLEASEPDGARRSFGPLAVIEIKQAALSLGSPMRQRLAAAGHREQSLSKYAAAISLLRPDERMNRLRPDLRVLERVAR